MPHQALGALIAALICLAVSPYLARLTLTVPDVDDRRWWTGAPVRARRAAVTALIAAVLGALGGYAAGLTALLPSLVVLAAACAPLVVIDYETHRLPDRLVFPAAGAGAALLAFAALAGHDWHRFARAIESGVVVYAVLFTLWFFAPGSFGRGDVKIGAILGGYLGWFGWVHVYYGIFAGFLLGAIVAVGLLITRRASMKTAVPFGPTLILGPFLVLAFDLVPSAF